MASERGEGMGGGGSSVDSQHEISGGGGGGGAREWRQSQSPQPEGKHVLSL